jgi:hypothetical protein
MMQRAADQTIAELAIAQRGGEYWLLVEVGPDKKELGPFPTLDDARLYFDYFMGVAKKAGATELPINPGRLM